MIFNVSNRKKPWRAHEESSIMEVFNSPMMTVTPMTRGVPAHPGDVVVWRPETEKTTVEEHRSMVLQEESMPEGVRMINRPSAWMSCHSKAEAFSIWHDRGLPAPKNETIVGPATIPAPVIVRADNQCQGLYATLCQTNEERDQAIEDLAPKISSLGGYSKMISTEFIDTRVDGCYRSYRIIVAGDRVICGYGRVSGEWMTITSGFTPEIASEWEKVQVRCNEICEDNRDLLVQSVAVTGNNHVGVDVIEDQMGNLFLLEIQPMYSAGYAGRPPFCEPFFNPYQPPLVEHIVKNLDRFKREIPLYVKWLDKKDHFMECYETLNRCLS